MSKIVFGEDCFWDGATSVARLPSTALGFVKLDDAGKWSASRNGTTAWQHGFPDRGKAVEWLALISGKD